MVKKFFFNSDNGFVLIGVCSIYVWNVVAKFVKLNFFFFFREHPSSSLTYIYITTALSIAITCSKQRIEYVYIAESKRAATASDAEIGKNEQPKS